ncbi:hypothetical protein EJ08DRAFT_61154 [Tothia fuscella]|uniref:Uncharacterized protein n=1 Tax=Tothia fuscella TaxID=1048955 RepID=A0A9P4U257_9PEZI|nr:hypothetical protein EJ08DRAFT_61154 [Tothia fuscella]
MSISMERNKRATPAGRTSAPKESAPALDLTPTKPLFNECVHQKGASSEVTSSTGLKFLRKALDNPPGKAGGRTSSGRAFRYSSTISLPIRLQSRLKPPSSLPPFEGTEYCHKDMPHKPHSWNDSVLFGENVSMDSFPIVQSIVNSIEKAAQPRDTPSPKSGLQAPAQFPRSANTKPSTLLSFQGP